MKRLFLLVLSMALFGCAGMHKNVDEKVEVINYSLLDSIYGHVDVQVQKIIGDLKERESKVLRSPKYIKVYRGSFKDDKGNVVEGGFEWIKVDDGNPDTNF